MDLKQECKKCYTEPKSNRDYWLPKIDKNIKRDKKKIKELKKDGWEVKIIWEHDFNLRKPKQLIYTII